MVFGAFAAHPIPVSAVNETDGRAVSHCTPGDVADYLGEDKEDETDYSQAAPTGGGDVFVEGTEANKNAHIAFDILTEKYGISGAAAAGMLSNVAAESGWIADAAESANGAPLRFGMDSDVAPAGMLYYDFGPGGGGLYQETPYTVYTESEYWRKGGKQGWDPENQTDFIITYANRLNNPNASMNPLGSYYCEQSPFENVYDWYMTDDPAASGVTFAVMYLRPADWAFAQSLSTRTGQAEAFNAYFNKDNRKGDLEKIKKWCNQSAGGAATIDSLTSEEEEDDGRKYMYIYDDNCEIVKVCGEPADKAGDSSSASDTGSVTGQDLASAEPWQKAIVDAAHNTPSAGQGWCAAWVTWVYQKVGISVGGHARDQWGNYCATNYDGYHGGTSKRGPLEVGMIIATPSSSSGTSAGAEYGHVGIYIGDNKVIHNTGSIETWDLDRWISVYCNYHDAGWGYPSGIEGATYSGDSSTTSSDIAVGADASRYFGKGYVFCSVEDADSGFTNADEAWLGQWQQPWGSMSYWGGDYRGWACGATSMTMITNILNGTNDTPPDFVAKRERVANSLGYSGSVFWGNDGRCGAAKEVYLKGFKIHTSENYGYGTVTTSSLKQWLSEKKVVLLTGGSNAQGQWLTWDANGNVVQQGRERHPSGHYIVCYAYRNGTFYVHDPGEVNGKAIPYTESQMAFFLSAGHSDATCFWK